VGKADTTKLSRGCRPNFGRRRGVWILDAQRHPAAMHSHFGADAFLSVTEVSIGRQREVQGKARTTPMRLAIDSDLDRQR